MRTPLVRHGADAKLDKGAHCFVPVHLEMLLQVTRDYSGLPPPDQLKAYQIRLYYEGLRRELQEGTRPRGPK